MSQLVAALVLFLALAIAGCSGTGNRGAPGTLLQRALFLSERDERGNLHPISRRDEQTGSDSVVERIGDGATIDVNSKLVIGLRRRELGVTVADAVAIDLAAQARTLDAALDTIGDYYSVVQQAELAWLRYDTLPETQQPDSRELVEFEQLRRRRATLEKAILDPIRVLWPRDEVALAADRLRVEDLVTALEQEDGREQALQDLNAMIQARIDSWNQRTASLAATTDAAVTRRRLRIEAFIVSGSSSEPHAVHVPGYDELDQGTISRIDRFGVLLTEGERAHLQELSAASAELAAALERLRKREATWHKVFADVTGLVDEIAELNALAKRFEDPALAARINALEAAFRTFEDGLAGLSQQALVAQLEDWRQSLRNTLGASNQVAPILALAAELEAIARRWRRLDPADVPQLLLESVVLGERVKGAVETIELHNLLADFKGQLETAVSAAIATAGENRSKLEALWQPLADALASWQQDAAQIVRSAKFIVGIMRIKKQPPKLDLTNAAAFDVPLETASDTEIDLRTTPRQPGDLLQVTAKVLDGDDASQDFATPMTISLGIEKLGWHADLVPSVAYVVADRLAGPTDRGGFSPALSWMWSYTPRDDQGDIYLSRSVGWGAGLHATFLNFDPDRDTQFGIGATVSLWDNRLMAGAGYNLFADTEDEGRFYFFFGSSLIPLLQALDSDQ